MKFQPHMNVFEWHSWFAWRPVYAVSKDDGKCYTVWMQVVRRKYIRSMNSAGFLYEIS